VHHHFPGPHPYFRTHLLIVGGRNSALESALRCWRVGAQVTLSYRKSKIDTDVVKPHLLTDILTRIEREEIAFLPSTIPVGITPEYVLLASTDDGVTPCEPHIRHETDFVLPMIGYTADMSLLSSAGVTIQGEEQAPVHDSETMETNVPGIFIAGTAVGGTGWRLKHAIYTSHDHVAKIVKAISGQNIRQLGAVERCTAKARRDWNGANPGKPLPVRE